MDRLWGDGQLTTSANGQTLASLDYGLEPNGQLANVSSAGLGDSAHTYGYDQQTRLTSDNSDSYSYDSASNITQFVNQTPLTYDDASQLTAGPAGRYTYDQQGERTTVTPGDGSAATSYAYDEAGRLNSVTGGASSLNVSYSYDGDGLLASRNSSATTQNVWDPSTSLPMLLSDGAHSYVYGPSGLPLEQIDSSGTPLFYHHDQIGSTRLLTNLAGTAVETVSFSPYGEPSVTSGTAQTPLLFAGQYTDPETGLIYMRARWYDPQSGQFISVDPAVAQPHAPYVYANDEPLNGIDPLGLWSWNPFSDIGEVANAALPIVHVIASGVAIVATACAIATSETIVGGLTCGAIAAGAAGVTAATGVALNAEGRESCQNTVIDVVGAGLGGGAVLAEAKGLVNVSRILGVGGFVTSAYGQQSGGG